MADQAIARPAAHPQIEFNEGKIQRDMLIRKVGKIGLLLNPIFVYFFLWAPILILVIFSFNDSRSVASWQGFTTRWYTNIFSNVVGTEARFSTENLLTAFGNSIFVGVVSTLIATVIGTMVAISLVRGAYPGKRLLSSVLYLPVVIPEITQGVSLLIFFKIVFDYVELMASGRAAPGFGTIIIGHVVFSIAFVAIVVRARLVDMNPRFEEAARDLGANEWKTFWLVTFPLLLPAIIAGALLAFTLSLDDYIVTAFTTGPGTTTLPIFVYGLLKLSVTPEINAISTIMLVLSTLLVGASLVLQGRNATQAA
jgi:spermidine/putrescine transport system permease protein